MNINNHKKNEQLGMPFGTANNRLRKIVLFELLKKHGENICFQCGNIIESVDELSLEHKVPWLNSENPQNFFFNLENIGFSHLCCNVGARRYKESEHGTYKRYSKYKCRCDLCKKANADNRATTRHNHKK